jgi:flagellar basal body-associated protein FliL
MEDAPQQNPEKTDKPKKKMSPGGIIGLIIGIILGLLVTGAIIYFTFFSQSKDSTKDFFKEVKKSF